MTNTISVLYTIEQKRAQKAYDLVQYVIEEKIKEYKSAADKFPAMIVNCGLLQVLSFYKSKNNLNPVFNSLKTWFCEHYNWGADITDTNFLYKTMKLEVFEYREKTQEALAFLTWLKRFADIKHQEIKQKSERSKDGEGGKYAS